MPLPSYHDLRNLNRKLMLQVAALSTDAESGLFTKNAIPFELEKVSAPRYVIVLQCACHPSRIRKVLRIRSADTLLRARWSDDTYIFLTDVDPTALVQKLRAGAQAAGTTFGVTFTKYSGDLTKDVGTCQALLQAQKEGHHA
jgi:hypothetical protein